MYLRYGSWSTEGLSRVAWCQATAPGLVIGTAVMTRAVFVGYSPSTGVNYGVGSVVFLLLSTHCVREVDHTGRVAIHWRGPMLLTRWAAVVAAAVMARSMFDGGVGFAAK